MIRILFVLLFPFLASAQQDLNSKIVKPFCSDGCTGASSYNRDYLQCCVAHDLAYYKGGHYSEKSRADADLRICAQQSGLTGWFASLATMGTSAFGDSYWGAAWGNTRPSPFHDPLTEPEQALVLMANPQVANVISNPMMGRQLRYDQGYQNYLQTLRCQ